MTLGGIIVPAVMFMTILEFLPQAIISVKIKCSGSIRNA
jgi:hypothetical protein